LNFKNAFKDTKEELTNFFTGKGNPTTYNAITTGLGIANNYMNKDLVNSDDFD
jgi:hypothetical protein